MLEKFLFYLIPDLKLKQTPWHDMWAQEEREKFILSMKIFFPIAGITYLGHFFFFDLALNLLPVLRWALFRFSMVAICIFGFIFYSMPFFSNSKYYKIFAIIACTVFSVMQAKVMVWYPSAPNLYPFLFDIISVYLISSNIFIGVLYLLSIIILQWNFLIESNQSISDIMSAIVVSIIFVFFLKSNSIKQVNYFILEKEKLEEQKNIIKLTMDFNNKINSFLPKEISKRLLKLTNIYKMSIGQAIESILRPRQEEIACLFSDIRGYTKASRDLTGFVKVAMLPNVKACTDAIEEFSGIPRKIGDLIFAYYDHTSSDLNLINAIISAIKISLINMRFNKSSGLEFKIKRYILLSLGEAIVGNLGGNDSTIEITALGSPVNFLSRLDSLTKEPIFAEKLKGNEIIFSEAIGKKIINLGLEEVTNMECIDLKILNLKIRDFEDVRFIYLINNIDNKMEEGILSVYHKIKSEAKEVEVFYG